MKDKKFMTKAIGFSATSYKSASNEKVPDISKLNVGDIISLKNDKRYLVTSNLPENKYLGVLKIDPEATYFDGIHYGNLPKEVKREQTLCYEA